LGNAILRLWSFGRLEIGSLLIQYLRSIFLIGVQSSYRLSIKPEVGSKYNQIIVSWAKQSDFLLDGSYHDRYLQTNSKDIASTLWILITLDGRPLFNLNANIGIIERDPLAPKYDYVFLVKTIYRKIIQSKGRWKNFVFLLSATTAYAEQVADLVCSMARDADISCLLMPYEAQPFQNETYSRIKIFNSDIHTIGYLHSSLAALPVDLLYRRGAPDTLWVHGDGQREILCSKLGWPSLRVKKIKSLRYKYEDKSCFGGQIFLPYSFSGSIKLADSLRDFFVLSKKNGLSAFTIRNHPLMVKSKIHIALGAKIEALIQRFDIGSSEKKGASSLSIFIGVTAGMIEALEKDIEVVQICSNPIFESHSQNIWSSFSVKELGKNIFSYELNRKGEYIEFGDQDNTLQIYLYNQNLNVFD
jgi:hypothetical protein